MLARLVRDRDTCRVSELIACPYNEVLEGILRNEIAITLLYSLALFSLHALFSVCLPIRLFQTVGSGWIRRLERFELLKLYFCLVSQML